MWELVIIVMSVLSVQSSDSSVFDPISLLPENDMSEGRAPTAGGIPPEVSVLEPNKTMVSDEKLKGTEPPIATSKDTSRVGAKSIKRMKLTKAELKREVDMVSQH